MPYRESTLDPPPRPPRRSIQRTVAVAAIATLAAVTAVRWVAGRALRSVGARPIPASQLRTAGPVECEDVLAGYEAGGRRLTYCGPLRGVLSSTGNLQEVAVQGFASPIRSATRADDGWIFLSEDGTAAYSGSFVGRLHGLGRMPCPASLPRSRGRLVVIDGRGALWTTDGHGPVRRVALPSRVLTAAFRDANHGAVMLERQEVLATADGGATWRRVALGAEVAWNVLLDHDGRLTVATTAGVRFVGPAGDLEGASCDPDSYYSGHAYRNRHTEYWNRREMGRFGGRVREVFGGAPARPACPAEPQTEPRRAGPNLALAGVAAGAFECTVGALVDAPSLLPHFTGPDREGWWENICGGDVVSCRDFDGPARQMNWRRWEPGGFRVVTAGPAWRGSTPAVQNFDPPAGDSGRVYPYITAVSERGAVFQKYGEPWLTWAPTGGAFVPVPQPTEGCLPALGLSIAAALPDGGVVYVLSASASPHREAVVALDLGPDGRVRARRSVLRDDLLFAVALWRGALGVVFADRARPTAMRFLPLDGSPERDFQAPTGDLRACEASTRAGDADATTLWSYRINVSTGEAFHDAPGRPVKRLVEVGWGREGPCLRSVRVTASEGRASTLFARPGNRLEGVADNFSTVRRVACVGRASP